MLRLQALCYHLGLGTQGRSCLCLHGFYAHSFISDGAKPLGAWFSCKPWLQEAAWGGFSTGNAFAAGGDFPGKIILEVSPAYLK